jgi:hypothetical protein
MTELFVGFLALAVLTVTFAILTNWQREHRHYKIQLKPNCLLTRHPVVFVTGPRSLFYFRKYWNAYPEVLAEHGYEVFTLHLPWQGPARRKNLEDFLSQQQSSKKFHFICDVPTAAEFKTLFAQTSNSASVTVLKSETPSRTTTQSFTLNLAYRLHSWRFSDKTVPQAEDLGLHFPHEGPKLLKKMQELGEQDFLS